MNKRQPTAVAHVKSLRRQARYALVAMLVVASVQAAIAQIITTYAGGGYGDGGPATSGFLPMPVAVATDSAGNLYVSDKGSNTVRKVTPAGTISTVAGNGSPGFAGDGGPATSASLYSPGAVAVDSAGNLYIADEANRRVRKVTPAGTISTVPGATSTNLVDPTGVAVDSAGNLYIADFARVWKVTPSGIISTVAGNGSAGFSGDGGPATSASLDRPMAVSVDSAGNLYIADNNRIRKVTLAGTISTVAGNGTLGYAGDGGPATSASLGFPHGVAVDSGGNLYIADTSNQRVRMVTPAGTISTIAGNGTVGYAGDGGPATSAVIHPEGVALDSNGNLFIAEGYNRTVRKVTPAGIISTVAGSPNFAGDGGPATNASLSAPSGIAFDSSGNLYVADFNNQRIRMITAAGTITTVVGDGVGGYFGDGGPATSARLDYPAGVALDSANNLFIADNGSGTIRKVIPTGTISTVAGNGTIAFADGVPATSTGLYSPTGVTLDSGGNLYIADQRHARIRKVDSAGTISTVAGGGALGFLGDGGPATSAALSLPSGVALDSAGNLYIADTNNNRIRMVTPAGAIFTVAGNGTAGFAGDDGPATSASLNHPFGVAVDSAGNIYIADSGNQRIRRVTPAGTISTVAGDGIAGLSGDGGPAISARLADPRGIAIDSSGNLYIADYGNQRIRKVTLAPGADLAITQSAAPSTGSTGKDIMFVLTVTNYGTLTATSVVVTDVLPASSSFVWASAGCSGATTLTCNVGSLAPGTSTQVSVVLRPATTATITHIVSVSSAQADATPANNSSTAAVTVNASPVANQVLRYRLYSDVTKEHHFTTDLNEYNTLGTYTGTWVQEGTVGKVLDNPGSFNGVTATPYYRLYNTQTRFHHWTTDPNEYYTLIQFPQYDAEGVDGYILPTNTAGATQLYRLLYPFVAGLHHWTIDVNEYNALITQYGWIGEGGTGFVIQ